MCLGCVLLPRLTKAIFSINATLVLYNVFGFSHIICFAIHKKKFTYICVREKFCKNVFM